jgi:copper oxidase (laccase) domain-containing protein
MKKYFLDLPTVIVDQLLQVGVQKKNIEVSKICTSCHSDYFSYRRAGGITGRFGGVVCLR